MDPSTPRMMRRPTSLPIARAALLAAASIGDSRVRPFGAALPLPPGKPIFSRMPPSPPGDGAALPGGLRARALGELLVGRLAIDGFLVVARDQRLFHRGAALVRRDGADARAGRDDEGALHRRGCALLVEEGHQRLAHRKLGDGFLHVHLRVLAKRRGGGLHGLLVARREGAQRVLHSVAELAQHRVGHVERVLRDEVDAHALGAHQAHHLLDALESSLAHR
jgi:hypothetical protein